MVLALPSTGRFNKQRAPQADGFFLHSQL